jgi:hypothetical protein
MRRATRRLLQTLAAATLLWLVWGFIYAEELAEIGLFASWPRALAFTAVAVLGCWIPLTLVIIEAARRITLSRRTLAVDGAKLALAVAGVLLLHASYYAAAGPFIDTTFPELAEPSPGFVTQLGHSIRFSLLRVIVLFAAGYAWVRLQRAHEHRLHVAELEAGLAHARLDTLSAQLNPHFLFNALNSIAELIHADRDAADRMLVALSALLRRSLASPGHEVCVRDEVALVAQYLAIERIRLGARLDVRWSVDPSCLTALMPTLMLQPLAENAIVHGIARRRTPGTIDIAIRRTGTRLVVEMRNDARTSDAPPRETGAGIGLANTQARLRCLYGDDWTMSLTGGDEGTVVRVELPLRFAATDGAAATEPA